jgi:hypothetical protein
MGNNRHREANHSLSEVVTSRGRDLVVPKGIDGGEMLAWANADELLAQHLASDAKAFWKDGFLLYTLWATGDFCGMTHPEGVPVFILIRGAAFISFSAITARRSARRRGAAASRYSGPITGSV